MFFLHNETEKYKTVVMIIMFKFMITWYFSIVYAFQWKKTVDMLCSEILCDLTILRMTHYKYLIHDILQYVIFQNKKYQYIHCPIV